MTLFSWIDSCWFQVLKLFKYGLVVWVWLTSLVASLCPRYTEWIWGCEMFPSNSHADGAPTIKARISAVAARCCVRARMGGWNEEMWWAPGSVDACSVGKDCGRVSRRTAPISVQTWEFLILLAASDEPAKLDFLRKKVKCLPRNPCSQSPPDCFPTQKGWDPWRHLTTTSYVGSLSSLCICDLAYFLSKGKSTIYGESFSVNPSI